MKVHILCVCRCKRESMRLVPVLPNIAPSNVGEQESHNQHHRRAHTSFRLNLSLEDEERSPSFDDDMELQLRRHRAISIASQTDCDEGDAAEERDD